MKAKILSLICALLMALGLQAQNAEFETATGMPGTWYLAYNNVGYEKCDFHKLTG